MIMTPEKEDARRIAFTIAKAEAGLGLCETRLPAADRMQAILDEAAMRPADIDPGIYGMVYRLVHGSDQK